MSSDKMIKLRDFSREGYFPYTTLIKWIADGKFKVEKLNGILYVSLPEIKKLIDSNFIRNYFMIKGNPELILGVKKSYERYLEKNRQDRQDFNFFPEEILNRALTPKEELSLKDFLGDQVISKELSFSDHGNKISLVFRRGAKENLDKILKFFNFI